MVNSVLVLSTLPFLSMTVRGISLLYRDLIDFWFSIISFTSQQEGDYVVGDRGSPIQGGFWKQHLPCDTRLNATFSSSLSST